jgi:hypothetical protein
MAPNPLRGSLRAHLGAGKRRVQPVSLPDEEFTSQEASRDWSDGESSPEAVPLPRDSLPTKRSIFNQRFRLPFHFESDCMDPVVVEPLDSFGWAYDPQDHGGWGFDAFDACESAWTTAH